MTGRAVNLFEFATRERKKKLRVTAVRITGTTRYEYELDPMEDMRFRHTFFWPPFPEQDHTTLVLRAQQHKGGFFKHGTPAIPQP